MVEISADRGLLTFVNVFVTTPQDRPKLIAMLQAATEQTMSRLPGFVSAALHSSSDGTRVLNYVQWASREDFDAMFKHAEALAHMRAIGRIASGDKAFYDVVTVCEPAAPSPNAHL